MASRRLDTLRRVLGRDRIWTSRMFSHALCSSKGEPIYVGSSFAYCLRQYVLSRGRILLDDGPAVAMEFERMTRDGYTIRLVTVKAFVSDDDIIRSCKDGKESDKAEQAKWAKEERARTAAQARDEGRAKEGRRPKKAEAKKKTSPARPASRTKGGRRA
jgi:hypothetical protein